MFEFSISAVIVLIGASLGCLLGISGLLFPTWVARTVRLQPYTYKTGGWAEFRANYGGALLFLHAAIIFSFVMQSQAGLGSLIGTSFATALYWTGMALGRVISILLDTNHHTFNGYNVIATVFELSMALAMAAPFLDHLL